jgi:hypothetical protein
MANKIEIDPLLYIDPQNYSTGIAYIRDLIEADPTICLDRWRKIVKYHGIYEKRGFSRTRYHKAVQEWRKGQGYEPMGSGSRGAYRPANWRAADSGSESPENGLGVEEAAPAVPEEPEAAVGRAGAALADLVWEWMDENGYENVIFWDDGEVQFTRRQTARSREFKLSESDD